MEDSKQEILLEDYKLKVQYLVDQYTRMWNRFNYFLTLHTAISAGLFSLIVSNIKLKSFSMTTALMGLVLAIFWYIFGAQDRYLAKLYRQRVTYAQKQIEVLKNQPSIVSVDSEKLIEKIPCQIYQWRLDAISVTKLAAWFPIVMIFYWLVLIFLVIRES